MPVNGGSGAVRILVDGHGGDDAPAMVIEALKNVRARYAGDGVQLGIAGIPDVLSPMLDAHGLKDAVELVAAGQMIDMCESPAIAMRRKKDSSMHVCARAVRDGSWDAFVSAGNTGALMAISKFILKTLPGIDRPAIASMIPSLSGKTLLLDAGANVDCHSDHLLQFAIMGACYMQCAEGIANPRVGLLNIGSEDIKGTDVIKVAADKMRASNLDFIGNVEGTDIFRDHVDVVVCDGFTGNVALKSIEGTAGLVLHHLKAAISRSIMAKLGMALASGAMRSFRVKMDPSHYNGAPLLGLNGIVVKSHGSASAEGFASTIDIARREVEARVLDEIIHNVQQLAT
ncbi:MAG: phosphate acyltransferase PlsX [Mariprofundaceae bacterium]